MKNDRKHTTVSIIRPVVQGLFLFLFIYLFWKASFPFQPNILTNFFFNINPLVGFAMVVSGSAILGVLLFSGITIILTLVFGRVFCGWACPLGTVLDISSQGIEQRKSIPKRGNSKYKNYKYYGLIALLIGTAAGYSGFMFFDPIVMLFRSFALVLRPFTIIIANSGLDFMRPLAMRMEMYGLATFTYSQPVYYMTVFSTMLFIGVIGLVYVERRFWCRNLCPLGGFLSLLSRWSVRGRQVDDKCTSCSLCSKECPMNAIAEGFKDTSSRECIQCQKCEQVCPVNAVSFGFGHPEENRSEINPSRRGLMVFGLGGLFAGLAAGSSVHTRKTGAKLLRPPGSIVESDFLKACIRCGECMKICPTNGLQPAKLQAGFEGFYTPVLVPRIGGCEKDCNLCGQICPTGAIRKLPLEEKQFAVIGNAMIDRQRCIAWEQLKVCLICDEVCPYNAIDFKMVTDEIGTLQRPFVNEEKCLGCGQCEHGCPVNGPAAIHITPVNEVRKNTGTYITERIRQLREMDDHEYDFYDDPGYDLYIE